MSPQSEWSASTSFTQMRQLSEPREQFQSAGSAMDPEASSPQVAPSSYVSLDVKDTISIAFNPQITSPTTVGPQIFSDPPVCREEQRPPVPAEQQEPQQEQQQPPPQQQQGRQANKPRRRSHRRHRRRRRAASTAS